MRILWIKTTCLAVFLATALVANTERVSAQQVNCTAKKNDTVVHSTPTILGATESQRLSQNDTVHARAQSQNTGVLWLQVSSEFVEGWVDARDVNCKGSTANLPKKGAPGKQAEGSGFLPASNQRGAGVNGVFVPPNVKRGDEDLDVFEGRLEMLFDPSIKAFERGVSVRSVEFLISDGRGNRVFSYTDRTEPYCLFEDRQGKCPATWNFADTDNRWPVDGRMPLRPSNFRIDPSAEYQLTSRANYSDGNSDEWVTNFRAIPAGTSTGDQNTAPPPSQGSLVVEVVETEPGSTSTSVQDSLRLQLRAYDTAVGTSDGAGIARVAFSLFDPSGALVWKHDEAGAPYCLFSNPKGASRCNTWALTGPGAKWPEGNGGSGAAIQSGSHTVRVTVTPNRGTPQNYTYTLDIQGGE